MVPEDVRTVVQATLVLARLVAGRTRTPADDLFVTILRSSEDRLVEAVLDLMGDADQPPSDERAAAALAAVGIRV
jgi:hypothetical protein